MWPFTSLSRHRTRTHHHHRHHRHHRHHLPHPTPPYLQNDENDDLYDDPVRQNRSQFRPIFRPIYIYPGLKRNFRETAIVLDQQIPASVYHCPQCSTTNTQTNNNNNNQITNLDQSLPAVLQTIPRDTTPCKHPQDTCTICLETFHPKDLIRKLPCSSSNGCPSHFHSRCILSWLTSRRKYRCPLCNNRLSQETSKTVIQTRSKSRMDIVSRSDCCLEGLGAEGRVRFNPYGRGLRGGWNGGGEGCGSEDSGGVGEGVEGEKEATGKRGRTTQSYSYIVHDPIRFEVKSR